MKRNLYARALIAESLVHAVLELADEWETDSEVTGIEWSEDLATFIGDLRSMLGDDADMSLAD